MRIILVSATGNGGGKTTLAHKFTETVISLADEIRKELSTFHPTVNFFDKSQEGKLKIVENGMTMRDLLIKHGQYMRTIDKNHWVNLAIKYVKNIVDNHLNATIAIDDIRYTNELQRFREEFGSFVTHIHIIENSATPEPQYENDKLELMADYSIRRN